MFKKILIANRGEIACRVIKTAKKMNIKTVAVYSDADRYAEHVRMADESVYLGKSPASESYLKTELIIKACKDKKCDALHPGYGFLSENANFAEALDKADIVFIGPSKKAIASMGDKIESKKIAKAAEINTVPGYIGVIENKEKAVQIADEIGYPVMIKASAGGGGKGMRIAFSRDEVADGFERATSEAINSFGDERIFIEKFITEPRHIEIQVLADKHGNTIYLGERECSIQRRNQKVIEEAPSPFLDEVTRKKMGNQAVRLAEKVGYSSAGTVEFIVDKNKNFYFLEMNTRLQVEHPVTELITGVDLVEQMICIAYGEKLKLTQDKIVLNGSAIESRIYAENPYKNFLPSIGRLTKYHPPQEKTHDDGSITRNDTGVREGDEVSMFYDPMIAKLCSWGKTREISIKRMETALDNFLLEGIDHNIPFLSSILGSKRFKSGDLTTSFIEDEYPKGYNGRVPDKNEEWILSTLFLAYYLSELSKDFLIDNGVSEEWEVQIKNKNIASETINFQFKIKKSLISNHEIYIKPLPLKNVPGIINDYIEVNLQKNYVTKLVAANIKLFDTNKTSMPELIQCRINNTVPNLELSYRGITLSALILPKHVADYHKYMKPIKIIDKSNLLLCPMPGKLIKVLVKEGDTIEEGQALCVVEAMKMENTLLAEKKCIINKINFREGDTVSVDETIMELNFEK
ncbi:MAG: acetyl/propionyl/methylcrotonyl-CoA carboxylase subunit alpha [Alphaproteobacteria bacterium]|nr:acetyl/propionyl/methylcrotonyl-CoA carboxylase subunit alpha [Alphaproteobacteria bacterium]